MGLKEKLSNIKIHEMNLSKEEQREFEKLNDEYGAEFDKRYEARMKEYREAARKHRGFVINI